MEFDKELLKNAFALIERERKEQFDRILEPLLAGGLTPGEEQALKIRLEKNADERNELLEMIRVGVFEGTPFEDSLLYREIVNIPSTKRTIRQTEKKSSYNATTLIVCASIFFVCFLGIWRASFVKIGDVGSMVSFCEKPDVDFESATPRSNSPTAPKYVKPKFDMLESDEPASMSESLSVVEELEKPTFDFDMAPCVPGEERLYAPESKQLEEQEKEEQAAWDSDSPGKPQFKGLENDEEEALQLVREELNDAFKEGGFEQPTNETLLLRYGFGLNGEIDVAKASSSTENRMLVFLSAHGEDSSRSSFSGLENEETKRVERAFEYVIQYGNGSNETRLDYATFVLCEEHNPKRAKEILDLTRPESSRKFALLGVAEFMEGKPEKALDYFRSARNREDLFEYALDEAVCLTRLDRFEEARPIFIDVLKKIDDEKLKQEIQEFLDKR